MNLQDLQKLDLSKITKKQARIFGHKYYYYNHGRRKTKAEHEILKKLLKIGGIKEFDGRVHAKWLSEQQTSGENKTTSPTNKNKTTSTAQPSQEQQEPPQEEYKPNTYKIWDLCNDIANHLNIDKSLLNKKMTTINKIHYAIYTGVITFEKIKGALAERFAEEIEENKKLEVEKMEHEKQQAEEAHKNRPRWCKESFLRKYMSCAHDYRVSNSLIRREHPDFNIIIDDLTNEFIDYNEAEKRTFDLFTRLASKDNAPATEIKVLKIQTQTIDNSTQINYN